VNASLEQLFSEQAPSSLQPVMPRHAVMAHADALKRPVLSSQQRVPAIE